MGPLTNRLLQNFTNPDTAVGAMFYGVLFLLMAIALSAVVRRFSRHMETHLTDVTGLRFASSFAHVIVFLIAFIFYARVIPELRALGTTILAGVSVISVVLGLAAQNTLSNLVSGIALVLYRPISVGDCVKLATPDGVRTATVEAISLGYTILRDSENQEIIVPNSIMVGTVVIRLRQQQI